MNLFENGFSRIFQEGLSGRYESVSFEKGAVIVREGDVMRKIPFLKEGLIRVYKEDVDLDREVLLYYVHPGQTCMMSLIAGLNDNRSLVGARLEKDSEILLVPTVQIKTWQSESPEFNKFILNTFIERYFELINTISDLAFENVEIRLEKLLASRYAANQGSEIRITHNEIARILGTTRVVISRILKKMEQEGKVNLGRGFIKPVGLKQLG